MAVDLELPRGVALVAPGPLDPRAEHLGVEMRDGIRLATDVYHPATQPAPTVLVHLPYDKCGRYTFMPQLAAYISERGFAAVIQDVRGKFRSEGEHVPFVHERDDGYDTLRWLADQDWCDGNVGMIGDSYYGFTQWAAAASGRPALKAIVPRVTMTSFMWAADEAQVGRIPLYDWLLSVWSIPELYEVEELIVDPPRTPDGDRSPAWLSPTTATVRHLVAEQRGGRLAERIYPDGDPAARLTIPALHVGGWWDNCQLGQLAAWRAAQEAPAAAHQFLRFGAHDHEDYELRELGERGADHEAEDAALAAYLPRMLDEPLAFLDHYLRGHSGVWAAPRVRVEVAEVGWESAPSWPPPGAGPATLYLAATDPDADAGTGADTGALTTQPPPDPHTVAWIHDPRDPVPCAQSSDWGPLLEMVDEAPLHARADVLTFTVEPAGLDGLDLAGPVRAHLVIDGEAPTVHVIARLHDLYPDGRARFLLGGAGLVRTGRHAGPAPVTVELGDIAYRLRPGHTLRLAISGSCAGLYLVNPGVAGEPWDARAARRLTQSVTLGGRDGSRIELSVRSRPRAGRRATA